MDQPVRRGVAWSDVTTFWRVEAKADRRVRTRRLKMWHQSQIKDKTYAPLRYTAATLMPHSTYTHTHSQGNLSTCTLKSPDPRPPLPDCFLFCLRNEMLLRSRRYAGQFVKRRSWDVGTPQKVPNPYGAGDTAFLRRYRKRKTRPTISGRVAAATLPPMTAASGGDDCGGGGRGSGGGGGGDGGGGGGGDGGGGSDGGSEGGGGENMHEIPVVQVVLGSGSGHW